MRVVLSILTLTVLFAATAFGQWDFVKVFPDSSLMGGSGAHGIAVDPEGKVWVQLYGATDSIDTGGGVYASTRVLQVFHPDGTPASFSPIKTVTYTGGTDTLYNSARGLGTDEMGNILASHFDRIYKIDYKTGLGIAMVEPKDDNTLTAVASTSTGDVIVGFVIPPNPIMIFDKDFNLIGNVVDTAAGFARSLTVSADGNDVYWGGFNRAVYKYHSANGTFGPYSQVDTVLKGFSAESFSWNPKTSNLWASAGSSNDLPNQWWDMGSNYYAPFTWYEVKSDGSTGEFIQWSGDVSGDPRPRAIAFSVTGDTAYVGQFNQSGIPAVQMFIHPSVTSVQRLDGVVPDGYALEQNFPNPFNPSTEIRFSIGTAGFTTVRVYDMLGREVAQLVNSELEAGTFTARFNAYDLPSGTYVYEIVSGGVRLTKKMMLLK
jgi:hypothetical protein